MIRLYVIETKKPIECLGGIQGPLTTPTHIDINDVIDLVRRGYEVYQVNPDNSKEKVRVTINNLKSIKFSRSETVLQRLITREINKGNKPMMVNKVSKNDTDEKVEDTTLKNKKINTEHNDKGKKPNTFNSLLGAPDAFKK